MAQSKRTPKERRLARASDYRNVFGSGQGRRVLLDLMKEHHVMSPTVTGKQLDPMTMSFNEGQRNVVLRILKEINIDMDQLEKTIGEAENVHKATY